MITAPPRQRVTSFDAAAFLYGFRFVRIQLSICFARRPAPSSAVLISSSLFLRWYEGGWGHDYYLDLYGSGLMSNWELMISILTWLGIGMLVLSVILYLVGKKSDPIPEDDE